MEGNGHPTLPGFEGIAPGRLTPGGYGLRPHKTVIGTKRTPYEKWSKTATLYTWPLWRNWKPPKPIAVETTADIRKRERTWLRNAKPAGYSWRLEKLTPEQRMALGCLSKPAVLARQTRTRVAA